MASRSWAQDRAKRCGGSNIRGNKRQPWERTRVKGYKRRDGTRVKSYLRHKGKRKCKR